MFEVSKSLFGIVIHHISLKNRYELIYKFFTAVKADIRGDSRVGIKHTRRNSSREQLRKINHQLHVLNIFQKRRLL